MTFLKNSQLLFRIYSRFSGSLCVDRCRLNDVHVGSFSIHCLNENRRVNRAPLCEDRVHPLVSTFHNRNKYIYPMMFQFWTSVEDGGTTLNQLWGGWFKFYN